MHKYVHVIIGREAIGGHMHFPTNAQSYAYFNHVPETDVGDIVIVRFRAEFCNLHIAFAKVIEVHSDDVKGKKATKFIVDRIDFDKWAACTALYLPPEPE